jgi:hypothetical protein
VTALAGGLPLTAVPHAVTTPDCVRDGTSADVADVGDVVARKRAWRASHPDGIIGRPRPDQLTFAATVRGVELARAYDDMTLLMDLIDAAEAEGRCPLHPLAVGSPS